LMGIIFDYLSRKINKKWVVKIKFSTIPNVY
jgi:hypothetical protein